ncbi:MAG: polynucleotide adenylyltransferase PcnB, partial [Gallionella sp.]|nr:polynucleotide adenylyltransferase PcnB [Gallionella sp.]
RCASSEVDNELGLWWDEFQNAGDARRKEMLLPQGADATKKRRRKPRKKPAEPDNGQEAA